MLKRMSRRVNRADTEDLVQRLRAGIPNLVLRTTFITGFPGETDEQFEELEDFVSRSRFERMGVFTYSLEPDTPAAKLSDHLPERIKNERRNRLMALQQENAFAFGDEQIGKTLDVILDRPVDREANVWIGRSYADAPDVDALVYVTGAADAPLSAGKIVPCEIVATQDYDLVAAAVGEAR